MHTILTLQRMKESKHKVTQIKSIVSLSLSLYMDANLLEIEHKTFSWLKLNLLQLDAFQLG